MGWAFGCLRGRMLRLRRCTAGRHRAAGTRAFQSNGHYSGVIINAHQFNISAVCLQHRPDILYRRLNLLFHRISFPGKIFTPFRGEHPLKVMNITDCRHTAIKLLKYRDLEPWLSRLSIAMKIFSKTIKFTCTDGVSHPFYQI